MKKIGLIGGMSWESTKVYYEFINKSVQEKLGKLHSAKCIIESVDFEEIAQLQHKNNWHLLDKIMIESAKNLEKAKADLIVICTNTMHLCYSKILKNISIPILHIVEATGKKIKEKNCKKVLLLGTKFTMEHDFYSTILKDNYTIEVVVPNKTDRQLVHDVIYNELVKGIIKKSSREVYKNIINKAKKNGIDGVILGCTEIPLLIKPNDVSLTIFDTTKIHAESAVEYALQ